MDIYLDSAATTRVCPEAAQAAERMMTQLYGNPSSTHTMGRAAKRELDGARAEVAGALGCSPRELYFCSCGSEGDNWAIIRGAESMRRRGTHIISSSVEHDAVRKSMDYLEKQGFEITRLSPEPDGGIAVSSVLSALRRDTALISLMLVNNETGAITDIAAIARAVRAAGFEGLLHTDAVQGFMKVPFTPRALGADLVTISGHKIHAPKGVGALYIRDGVRLAPYIMGGGQENGLRAGTESLPLICAFAAAAGIARACFEESAERMAELRAHGAERLSLEIPGLTLIGGGAPHILSLSMPGYRSEVLMNYLEAREIYVSRSSACKKGGRSHVLEAMGLPPRVVDGALRVSLCRYTTQEEIDALCDALRAAGETLAHR